MAHGGVCSHHLPDRNHRSWGSGASESPEGRRPFPAARVGQEEPGWRPHTGSLPLGPGATARQGWHLGPPGLTSRDRHGPSGCSRSPTPILSLPGLGFMWVRKRETNKMDLMQDTPDLWSLPEQVGSRGCKSALGTCPESGTGGARSTLHLCSPSSPSLSLTLPSPGLGPHPTAGRALPCAPSDWQWLLLEFQRVCKDMRVHSCPARQRRAWGCL